MENACLVPFYLLNRWIMLNSSIRSGSRWTFDVEPGQFPLPLKSNWVKQWRINAANSWNDVAYLTRKSVHPFGSSLLNLLCLFNSLLVDPLPLSVPDSLCYVRYRVIHPNCGKVYTYFFGLGHDGMLAVHSSGRQMPGVYFLCYMGELYWKM